MRFLTLLLLAFLASAAPAPPPRPQLTFRAWISAGTAMYIQDNRVDVQGRVTGAVDRPSWKFTTPLTASAQKVNVEIRRGHGTVQIVEQPSAENQFTAVVQIEPPPEAKPELYVLDFYWPAKKPAISPSEPSKSRQ